MDGEPITQSGHRGHHEGLSIESASTLVTLLAHPELAEWPAVIGIMQEVGPRIGRALEDPLLPAELRAAIETRMLIGAAATWVSCENDQNERPMFPAYALIDSTLIIRGLEALHREWHLRMDVGRLFSLVAEAEEKGDAYVLPAGVTRPSFDQLLKHVLLKDNANDRKNFLERVWRPSRPVAHLAAAICSFEPQARAHWGRSVMPPDLIFSPHLFRAVLRRADELADLAQRPRLRKKLGGDILLRFSVAA